jgi:hypothetical protein
MSLCNNRPMRSRLYDPQAEVRDPYQMWEDRHTVRRSVAWLHGEQEEQRVGARNHAHARRVIVPF